MNVQDLHPWDVSPEEAKRIQSELRARVQLTDDARLRDIRLVAGVDNTYVRHDAGTTAYAVVVTLTFPSLDVVETAFASCPVAFPYVPGLLSFREAPAILAAFRRAAREPDVILFDGQGYAHFRRLGLASHLGVILDRPSIGCAKSRLVGRYQEPAREFGSATPLVDRGEEVGAAVRTRPSHAPLFVSPGHKVSIETAVRIVLACCRDNHFMPEPTRLAHELVTQHARERHASC
ncbi:MAG: deoxyribonuclease V [Chloroflexi bacterium]|nr:deoxyribonuclease V [Chloroflexota bacterium]